MESYIEEQLAALLQTLSDDVTLRAALDAAQRVQATIIDIQQYIRRTPFKTEEEQKRYFKHLAPKLYGRLFYYHKVSDAGVKVIHADEARLGAYFEQELAAIARFYDQHFEFCRYTELGEDHFDDRYYVRNARENRMLDCVEVLMADDFCVGTYWASWLWANRELRKFYQRELARLRQPLAAPDPAPPAGPMRVPSSTPGPDPVPELDWTDSIAGLIEVLYSFYLKGSFNSGKATFKDIVGWFAYHLQKDLSNYSNTVQDIGRRKKGQSKLLDELRDRLLRHFEELA